MFLALGLSSPLLGTGCLVADAPEYGPPQRTPPIIDFLKVTPLPYSVQTITMNQPSLPLNVPLRSEDAGDPIQGSLWLDYDPANIANSTHIEKHRLAPSTLGDDQRSYSISWLPDERVKPKECHSLTLLLMHSASFDDMKSIPDPIRSVGDVASVTWWVNFLPDDPSVLLNCPSLGETTQ